MLHTGRRSSVDSPTSQASPSGLSGPASGSLLVLLPDTEARDTYEYASDDEGDEEDNLEPETRKLSIPPLPPSVVFLYLLSPYLRLGAMYIPDGNLPFNYGLATLTIAALLSAFCRHIWFLLGRYLHKDTAEDILVETFTWSRDKGREHVFARRTISSIVGLFRVSLASLYLRDSVDCVLPFVPETTPLRSRLSASVFLGFLVLLSTSRSLATKQAIYTTTVSLASYMAWLIAVSHAYATYGLPRSSNLPQRGVLWNEISSIAFACTTTLTLPLSASLAAGRTTMPASQNEGAKAFQILNTSSTVLAAMLMLPLVLFASSSSNPETSGSTPGLLLSLLRMATLMMSVPTVVVSTPALPLPQVIHHVTVVDPSRIIVTCAIVALSLTSSSIVYIINDAVLFLAVSGTFLLPALTHIIIHYFRRPLSIVVPQISSSLSRVLQSSQSRPSSPDPLLRRKERLLQRRRLGERLLWDFGIWIILLPACGCALVWAAGRLALQW
ncbi:hypothetical protein F5I97DRAFT_1883943 [Phlebopus sp. FC_14]|nr:hypothetical protein F5I97DRAFT_1883943 [Phlebopus sp. FC_14]